MYLKLIAPILLFASAGVQSSPLFPRQGQDYFTGLLQTLNNQGLTTLASVLTQWGTTQQGQDFAKRLSGGNYTVLAPSNAALDAVLPSIQNDNSSLESIVSYHVINGSYQANNIASPRSHTIAPTLLTNETFVNLGGNPQVQVLEKTPNGNGVLVRRFVGNATVANSTTYQNLIIHVVNTTLDPPPDLKTALSSSLVGRAPNGFTQFGSSLQKVGLLDQVNNQTSQTVFAPIDEAFAAINSTISGLNDDQLSSVLKNHLLTNNVIYSPQLGSTSNATAVSSVQLNFTSQDGVKYVSYNQTRARILRSDVAVKNGVVHVIDAVLV